MSRRFLQHQQRWTCSLDGVWDFKFLGDVDADYIDIQAVHYDDCMAVPGCFDAVGSYASQRGLAAYRQRFFLREKTKYRLYFDAVHHWSRIYVDGVCLKEHMGGFTRFFVDLDHLAVGEHELVVLVDNRIDYERCPLHLDYFDWYHYGGISRNVTLHQLGKLWINHLRISTENYIEREVKITIDYDAQQLPKSTLLQILCDKQVVLDETINFETKTGTLTRHLKLAQAQLWSPDQPHLHMVQVIFGEDDYIERIGIRQVSSKGKDILINGQSVRLLGCCRHESHPQFGHTQPEPLLVQDINLLKRLGCNFVRGSHYPQDPQFLDLCDEKGLCVWSEGIGWQHTVEQLNDSHFIQAQLEHVDEMVNAAYNHPSVILWGILNEGNSHELASRQGYSKLLGRLRQLDSTRLITYASNHPHNDQCLDLVDVVSINTYPGWYSSEPVEEIPRQLDEIFDHLESTPAAGRPIIISEIGAGAIYGCRDEFQGLWSEEFQARLLKKVIEYLFADSDRVCGLSIWQFCDCRTTSYRKMILGRPRGFNNKGILNEYRQPKLAFHAVERLYNQLRKTSVAISD